MGKKLVVIDHRILLADALSRFVKEQINLYPNAEEIASLPTTPGERHTAEGVGQRALVMSNE
jgi:hypothetical protein